MPGSSKTERRAQRTCRQWGTGGRWGEQGRLLCCVQIAISVHASVRGFLQSNRADTASRTGRQVQSKVRRWPRSPSFRQIMSSQLVTSSRLTVLATRALSPRLAAPARLAAASALGETAFAGSVVPLRCAGIRTLPAGVQGAAWRPCMVMGCLPLRSLHPRRPRARATYPTIHPLHDAGSSRRPAAPALGRRRAVQWSSWLRRAAPRARPLSPCPTRPVWMPWPRWAGC